MGAASLGGEDTPFAQARLPMPASAMTQPKGQGVPSAKAPTSPDPMIPLPYCMAPTSADTAPARSGKPPPPTSARSALIGSKPRRPPYVVQAGTVIPAALITGIRSDLPGQNTKNICGKAFREADSAYAKFKAIFARYSSIGTALRSAIKSLPVCPTSVLNFWLSPVARA